MTLEYDYQFKLVLTGDSGGKTPLVRQFSQNTLANEGPTIGVDFAIKTIETLGKIVKLQVWDTAGQERFRSGPHTHYRNADGVVIVYDVTNSSSCEHISWWLGDLERHSAGTLTDIPKALVGNKADCITDRTVSAEEGQSMAGKYSMIFLETSAKTASNVEVLFLEVAKRVCSKVVEQENTANFVSGKERAGFGVALNTPRIGLKETTRSCCKV